MNDTNEEEEVEREYSLLEQDTSYRDAQGRLLRGYKQVVVGNPNKARRNNPKEKSKQFKLLIEREFEKIVDTYVNGELRLAEKKEIMAEHIANMVVFGQIRLPSDNPEEEGRVLRFRSDDYMKHLLRVLRYLEPPETEAQVISGVETIIWDLPIGQEVHQKQMELQEQELLNPPEKIPTLEELLGEEEEQQTDQEQ